MTRNRLAAEGRGETQMTRNWSAAEGRGNNAEYKHGLEESESTPDLRFLSRLRLLWSVLSAAACTIRCPRPSA